jgi:hypothetical protein
MRGLAYGLGAVVALAIAAPAFAGDLTSIEVDPSGKAIAIKKEPGKLAPIPDIGGIPNKGFNYGALYQVPPNSIIGKGINVMRGARRRQRLDRASRGTSGTDIRSLRRQRHWQDDPERQGWQKVRRYHLQAR